MSININELKCCSSEYVKKDGTEIPFWFAVYEAYKYLKLEEYEKLKSGRENEYATSEITPYEESSGKDKIWSQMAQKFEKKMERNEDMLNEKDGMNESESGIEYIDFLFAIGVILGIILLVLIFKI